MKIYKHSYWAIIFLFFLGCARQTTPTGGPKDTIPPTMVRSYPRNLQTNFKEKTIELTFTELITLNNAKEQIIITPNVGKDFEALAKKNKVIVSLKKDLNDSTTYSINFRESVQDLNEKNPAKNLKLAFSTGSYVDSLSIEGTVLDALTLKESKDITVSLYTQDTFNIFKHKPSYITKSNEKGIFKLENLKQGNYYIFAVDDKNKNLSVDSKTETYGFLTDTILLKQNVKNLTIPIIKLDARPLKISSARPYNTYFNIKSTKNLSSFKVTTEENETILSCFGEDNANIRIYNTIDDKDSLSIRLQAIDSIDNKVDTTFYIKFNKREVQPEKFTWNKQDFKVIEDKGTINGQIKFSKPIAKVNFDSIYYLIDSTKVVRFETKDLQWDSLTNLLTINKKFDKTLLAKPLSPTPAGPKKELDTKPKADSVKTKKITSEVIRNQFYIGKGTFISAEMDSTTQDDETLRPIKLEDTGIILVEVETKQPHFIVQLLDKDFKILNQVKDNKKFSFEDLTPGDYQLRLVIDKNNNAKWDPGNFFLRQPPESVSFHKNEKKEQLINLKANWELGPLLIKF